MQIITSKDNTLIKHICKLKEKKYRNEYRQYLIEGVKLLKEAIRENVNIKYIIINEQEIEIIKTQLAKELETRDYLQVSNKIFKIISEVENPQGILAVIEKNEKEYQIDYSQNIILALDDIQDPGNLGTIIRTADSVGLTQILISKGTVNPYNSKVIRSTMGSIFRINIIECENLVKVLEDIKKNNYKIIATSIETKESIYDTRLNQKVIVIGNEANGISKEILEIVDEKLTIPMLGKTESLNASVATGVILYEYVRQKLNTNC